MLEKIKQFFKEVRTELKKVTWPSRKEVINSTTVVLVTVSIVGLFLWMVDIGMQQLISLIIR